MDRTYTGTNLYRRDPFFKLFQACVRPLTGKSKEGFAEWLAPCVYLRACLGLQSRLWFGKRNRRVVMGRSLVDFLYLDRHSETPRFSSCKFLIRCIGRRILTVHCLVSEEGLQRRKAEMSSRGQAQYDQAMQECFTQNEPTFYLLFNNDADLEFSQETLSKILRHVLPLESDLG